jgi:D-serine deaminase-like pyridoxal phosphate-dependent protein
LVLDLDAFEQNLKTMAHFCKNARIHLRPHAKTHKSSVIARRQTELGAVGTCCATLDEAEVMSRAALPGILITSPIVSAEKIERLMTLLRRSPDTMIVVDNATNVETLDRAASRLGQQLQVLVDFDLGHHRTGVLHISDAIQLARHVTAHAGLQLAGIQAYGGHLQHIADYSSRRKRARIAEQSISQLTKALTTAGLKPDIVTGAGTGTHLMDGTSGTFTELQAGSYIFMDAEYSDIEYEPAAAWPFRIALFVQVAVIAQTCLAARQPMVAPKPSR